METGHLYFGPTEEKGPLNRLLRSAEVIDVVVRDIGASEGRLGGWSDSLEVGDVVGIDFVLNHNPHPEFPSYDGYLLSSMALDLVATGPGSLRRLF